MASAATANVTAPEEELERKQRDQELVDITAQVRAIVARTGIRDGLVQVYAQGATAAILIQESWDESVQARVSRACPDHPQGTRPYPHETGDPHLSLKTDTWLPSIRHDPAQD